jgi:hypothetical protein
MLVHPAVIITTPAPRLAVMLGLGIILGLGRTPAKRPPPSVGAVSRGAVLSFDETYADIAELSVEAL